MGFEAYKWLKEEVSLLIIWEYTFILLALPIFQTKRSCILLCQSSLESPSWVIISQPLVHRYIDEPLVPLAPVSSCILRSYNGPQCPHHYYIRTRVPHGKAVTHKEPRAISTSVKLRTQYSTQVPNRDLHRICRCALRLAANIVGRPGSTIAVAG